MIGVVVAARTGSRRLPGKALLPLAGVPMIAYQLRRLRTSRRADAIVLATTTRPDDDRLAEVAAAEGVPVFRGAEEDLVGRYVAAAAAFGFRTVVRVTGDCPFTDGPTLDACLEASGRLGAFDLATTKPAYPRGIDYEIYPEAVMQRLDATSALSAEHREHLTLFLYEHEERFRIARLEPPPPLRADVALLVDYPEDYARISAIAGRVGSIHAGVPEILAAAACQGGS